MNVVACVNDVIFVLIQPQYLLFIHSYCHHFGGSFTVERHFSFGHYWGQEHQQQTQSNNIMIKSNNNINNNTLGIILNKGRYGCGCLCQ
jgi:hypothetical protein